MNSQVLQSRDSKNAYRRREVNAAVNMMHNLVDNNYVVPATTSATPATN